MSFESFLATVAKGLGSIVEEQAPQLEAAAGAIVVALIQAGLTKLQPKQS